jgi:uncharacterized BrkB/YihY/UPF0761 family membrane protein
VWITLKSLAAKSVDKWNDEPAPRFAAALAFYTALTMAAGGADIDGLRGHGE